MINGTQLNPSQSMYDGSPLYLNPVMTGDGVQGNVAGTGANANFVNLAWTNYSPCQQGGALQFGGEPQPGISTGNATPTASPTVSSSTGNVDCGTSNAGCPFPAAGFPSPTSIAYETHTFSYGAPTGAPATTVIDMSACNAGATQLAGGQTIYQGQSISSPGNTSPNAELTYSVTVNFQGILEVEPFTLWSTFEPYQTGAPGQALGGYAGAGAYATMETNGDFVFYNAQGVAQMSSGTSGNPGAYLAIQNDGNLVVYSAQGAALWAASTGGDYVFPPFCPAP